MKYFLSLRYKAFVTKNGSKPMSLFQKSVAKKYVNGLEQTKIDEKYRAFRSYFGDSTRQKNIRSSKEEQFQEGFFRELFVNILGYTLRPDPVFMFRLNHVLQ